LQQKHSNEAARKMLVTRAKALGLTARESHVAILLVHGCSAKEIARELGITLHTARRHTESVLRKMGVDSRGKVGPRLLGLSR
jgi:DNA-binding NarL/FixJ family response regulator